MYIICITYLCTEGLKVDFLYSVDILFDVKETIFIMIWSLFSLSLTGQTKEQSQLIQRGFLGLTWKDAAIAILLITIIISCSTMSLWAIKAPSITSKIRLGMSNTFKGDIWHLGRQVFQKWQIILGSILKKNLSLMITIGHLYTIDEKTPYYLEFWKHVRKREEVGLNSM